VAFLTDDEIAALVAAPDPTTWIGRRDRTLLLVATQTGLRNSELTGLRRQDVVLDVGPHVRCTGKGRKARATPLRADVAAALTSWLAHQSGTPTDPLFPSMRGRRLSADALQRLVTVTSWPRGGPVRRSPRKSSPHIPCGTPRRWGCSSGGSI
jgi:site-specific recombinase XerC